MKKLVVIQDDSNTERIRKESLLCLSALTPTRLGAVPGLNYIDITLIKLRTNGAFENNALVLSGIFNWTLGMDDSGHTILVPTRK
jgi:hypothetical protein